MSFISQLASLSVYPTKATEEQSLEKIFQAAITDGACKTTPEEFWNAFWNALKLRAPSHRFEELALSFLNKVLSHPEHCLNCIASFLTIGNTAGFFQSWCEEIPGIRAAFWNREWQTLIQYLHQNNYSLSSPELQCLFIAEMESNSIPSLRNGDTLTALKACQCWEPLQFSTREASILVDLLHNPQQVSLCLAIGERYFAQQYGILFHYICLSNGIRVFEGEYQFLLTADYIRYFKGELPLPHNSRSISSSSSSSSEEIMDYPTLCLTSDSLPPSPPQPSSSPSTHRSLSDSFRMPDPLEAFLPQLSHQPSLQTPSQILPKEVVVIEDEEPLPAHPSQHTPEWLKPNFHPRRAPSQLSKIRPAPKFTYRELAAAPLSNGTAATSSNTSEFDRMAALHKSRHLDIQNPEEAAAKLITIHTNGGFAYEWVDAYVRLRDQVITCQSNEAISFRMLTPKLITFWSCYFNFLIAEFNANQDLRLWEIPFNSFHAIESPTAYLTFFKTFTEFLPSFQASEQLYAMAIQSIQQENKLDSILHTMRQTGFRPLTCELCTELLSIKTNLVQPLSNENRLIDPSSGSLIEAGTANQLTAYNSLTSTDENYDGF